MNEIEKSANLLRKELSSITLEDLRSENEKLTDAEAANMAADTELYYRSHFKKVLLAFLKAQMEEISKTAANDSMLQFGRGTFNGFMLIQEWFEKQTNISLARFDVKEEENMV